MLCAASDERESCSLSIRAHDSDPNIVSLGETKQLPVILMALLGAVTGALAAAAVDLVPLRDVGGIVLFGHCFGMRRVNECAGAPGAFYLFPGLIFGVGFAALLWWQRRLRLPDAIAFAIAATLANAAAVFVWTAIVDPMDALLEAFASVYSLFALTGAISGAVGGGLLGFSARRLLGVRGWPGVTATGAALGLLLPLLTAVRGGEFPFYILWQAGYAAALLARPSALNRPSGAADHSTRSQTS